MTRVKWRKSNSYFKSLEEKQQRRIKEAGREAYRSYTEPSVKGTTFSDNLKNKWFKCY